MLQTWLLGGGKCILHLWSILGQWGVEWGILVAYWIIYIGHHVNISTTGFHKYIVYQKK